MSCVNCASLMRQRKESTLSEANRLDSLVVPSVVWCPQYCSCVYEGGMVDLALCRTRAKAREILREHRRETMRPWTDDGLKYKRRSWEIWRVVKREVI